MYRYDVPEQETHETERKSTRAMAKQEDGARNHASDIKHTEGSVNNRRENLKKNMH
jgi:hypothetical protein